MENNIFTIKACITELMKYIFNRENILNNEELK